MISLQKSFHHGGTEKIKVFLVFSVSLCLRGKKRLIIFFDLKVFAKLDDFFVDVHLLRLSGGEWGKSIRGNEPYPQI
jgi:hypothetical protein